MKKLLFAACLTALSYFTQAQNSDTPVKIGYTNVSYIFSISPRSKEIESEIKSRTQLLQKEVEGKEKELQEKYAAYQKSASTMMESIRADKENEIRNLEQSIMNLRKNADAELRQKYEDLVSPESDKIQKAIKEVAKENGYTYVINGDPQSMLYGEEKYDITDLVLKKLGITRPAPGTETDADDKFTPVSSPKPTTGGGSGAAPVKRTVPNKKK
jgi:outer membrane protein